MFVQFLLLVLALSAENANGGQITAKAWGMVEAKYAISRADVKDSLLDHVLKTQKDDIVAHMTLAHKHFNTSYYIEDQAVSWSVLGSYKKWTDDNLKRLIQNHLPAKSDNSHTAVAIVYRLSVGIDDGSRKTHGIKYLTAWNHYLVMILIFGAHVAKHMDVIKNLETIFEIESSYPDLQLEADLEATRQADMKFRDQLPYITCNVICRKDNKKYLCILDIPETFEITNITTALENNNEPPVKQAYEEIKKTKNKVVACSRGRTWSKSNDSKDYLGKFTDTKFAYVVVLYIAEPAADLSESESGPTPTAVLDQVMVTHDDHDDGFRAATLSSHEMVAEVATLLGVTIKDTVAAAVKEKEFATDMVVVLGNHLLRSGKQDTITTDITNVGPVWCQSIFCIDKSKYKDLLKGAVIPQHVIRQINSSTFTVIVCAEGKKSDNYPGPRKQLYVVIVWNIPTHV